MATTRPSRAATRRARQASEGRVERRIYLASAIVGVAVLAIVIAGVILTVVLPPREIVAQVGDRRFSARDLAVRAKFAAVAESNSTVVFDPAQVIPTLTREEVIRQKAGDLNVSVSDEDLQKAIRTRIGVAEDIPEDAFRASYERYLGIIPLSREEYEQIVRADALRTKATEVFKAQVPEKGPQIHLLGVSHADREKLQALRDAVAGGKDFKAEAAAAGLVTDPAQADLAWFDPQSLPERIASVRELKQGELSEVMLDDRTGSYFLAQAIERVEDREYDAAVKDQVANRMYTAWLAEQERALVLPSMMSGNAKAWVQRDVERAVAEATRRSQKAQGQ